MPHALCRDACMGLGVWAAALAVADVIEGSSFRGVKSWFVMLFLVCFCRKRHSGAAVSDYIAGNRLLAAASREAADVQLFQQPSIAIYFLCCCVCCNAPSVSMFVAVGGVCF